MAALPGLGPKRIRLLYSKLKVRTLDDLRKAVQAGRLQRRKGFGPAIEKKLAAALKKPVAAKRFRLATAEAEAEALATYLRDGGRVVVAGSYRRRRETVGDLDILVTSEHAAAACDKLTSYDNVVEVLAHGPTRATVTLRSGLQVDLRAVAEESYGAALLYFTGSKAHNIALRGIANTRNWKLNEYGLFAGKRRIAGASEEEVYEKLGLAYILPEMREDRGEIALAKANQLPKLVSVSDIRGDLHVHSDWTDGTAPIEEMAAAAQACGYQYMALTDHSAGRRCPTASIRRGWCGKFARSTRSMPSSRASPSSRVSKSTSSRDGGLDLPDSTLEKLDVVVASVHSFFDLTRDEQTERVIRAMRNPCVSILGHPTGRLIGTREPYEIDMDRVLSAAADLNCCVEINAEPDRLDLNDLHAHAAKAKGVKIAVSTDAHSVHAFKYIRFGIDQARRAWLTAGDVINTHPLAELRKSLKRRALQAA